MKLRREFSGISFIQNFFLHSLSCYKGDDEILNLVCITVKQSQAIENESGLNTFMPNTTIIQRLRS